MEQPVPMDRLICGDVGYGKTEIAMRAAFKAVHGRQAGRGARAHDAARRSSTSTFARAVRGIPGEGRDAEPLRSPAEQKQIVAGLADGTVDIVIGTHRLLRKDVAFKDLGLVVVDEEQRFGVEHKERLKQFRTNVDVLTMTATPIPRTLEMALTGIREMSTIDTPPEDRQPVLTFVGSYDEGLALGAIRRELLREGQVFYVHNRVATIDRQAAWIQEQLPEARVSIAHGQMDEDQLERQMMRFWDREADVLVCTTIIESGLDIPNANTLIVDRADLLGLAQLYQLRGRVGRATSGRTRTCSSRPSASSPTRRASGSPRSRKHRRSGSGFRIAMRDLEIRGAGNLLGGEQSGHIAAVGFDAYARILQESMAEMKGEEIPEEKELRIDLPVKAFVPPGWVAQEALRLELYRRISLAASHEVLHQIRTETVDRYGALPDQVETLFAVASLRVTCRALGVEEISTYRDQIRIKPVTIPDALQVDLEDRIWKGTFHDTTQTLNLVPEKVFGTDLVRFVERNLVEAATNQISLADAVAVGAVPGGTAEPVSGPSQEPAGGVPTPAP